MKYLPNFYVLLFLSICLISCAPAQKISSPTPAQTQTGISSPTPEKTASPTQLVTSTPKRIFFAPVLAGTQVPVVQDEILKENASQVVQLARWGNGVAHQTIYSPDGNFILIATSLGIRICRSDTLELIKFIETPADIGSIAISPDGTILAAGERDRLLIYRMSDGALLKTIEKNIAELVFSPDGRFLVIGVGDWSICRQAALEVWNVDDWTLNKILADDLDCIGGIAFSPSGKYLAASYFDVLVWEIDDGQFNLKNRTGSCAVQEVSLAFTPDERVLVIGAYEPSGMARICLQRLSDGEYMGVLKQVHNGNSPHILPSPDNKFFATTEDGAINIWVSNPWKVVRTITNSKKDIFGVAWLPDGKNLLSSSPSTGFQVWNVSAGKLVSSIPYFDAQLHPKVAVAWSPDTRFIATGINQNNEKSQIMFQEAQTGLQTKFLITDGTISSLAFSPNGKMLAIGLEDDRAQIWNPQTDSLACTMDGVRPYGITSVDFSDDSSKIALNISAEPVQLDTENFQIWDVDRCANILTIEVESMEVITHVDIAPNQDLVAASFVGGAGGKILVWDVKTGSLVRTLFSPFSLMSAVLFSPDGKKVVSVNRRGHIVAWSVDDGKLLTPIESLTSQSQDASSFTWSPMDNYSEWVCEMVRYY